MKFLHAEAKITSRKKTGRTAAQSAAYRNGYGKFSNRKDQVIYSQVLLPRNCPYADFFKDPASLWELVDMTEKRADAQLFREFEFDLHNELPYQDQLDAVKDFCLENFTNLGMIANFAIHENLSGKHCHIMLTMREIAKNSKFPGFGKKNREWNDLKLVTKWRKNWQDKLNELTEYYNVEKISFSSIEEEQKKAIEKEDWLLAAELEVKKQTKLPHKNRPEFAQFMKNRGKARKNFLVSLRKAQLKRNSERAEMLKKVESIAKHLKSENVYKSSANANLEKETTTHYETMIKKIISSKQKQTRNKETMACTVDLCL